VVSYLAYRHSHYLTHPHEFIRETYLQIKWFIQRGRRGWADNSVWSFDHYLARVIYEGIERLRKSTYLGCPADFPKADGSTPDVKELLKCKEYDPRFEAWREELGKIASGFKAWSERDDWYETEEWDLYESMPKKERVEWARKKDKETYDKLQESLTLFKKYFVNLWD
jgi:hypothetical protein